MRRTRLVFAYTVLVGIPLIAVIGIVRAGEHLVVAARQAAVEVPAVVERGPSMPNPIILLIQIATIMATSTAVAMVFRKLKQPVVIGQMIAGIMLGPSLLGWVAPQLSASVFPPPSLGYLNALSQVGIVVYMFLVGLSLDLRKLREHGHTAVLTSHVSIVLPFMLGATTALFIYPRLSDSNVSFQSFAMFMGSAMSITAFPVLARILTERGVLGTKLGSLAIACAAVDDVTGWCVVAYTVLLVRSQLITIPLWLTIGGLGIFFLVMACILKPRLIHFEKGFARRGRVSEDGLILMILIVLLSAVITEWLGLHMLFGAFLAGAVMPKDQAFVRYILDKFETMTVLLLLPLYFTFTGLRTSIRLIEGSSMWIMCGAIVFVAVAGKLGGCLIAGRLSGSTWREATAVGVLMNTRGLMELVILNIGLDTGVISRALFSIMVLMALVTTFMTAPLFEWLYPLRASFLESEAKWGMREPAR
jgi:Kef-type K+ transport system membrane component KefB